MPIKIDIHDNSSHVRLKPKSTEPIEIDSNSDIDIAILEALIREEIANRIEADIDLQNQINSLSLEAARYILIDENTDGSVQISLLNSDEEVLDTKTITVTEKIIKSATLDYNNKKIIYTCNDDSVIELNISAIIDNISNLLNKVSKLENDLSIVDTKVENLATDLSIIKNETVPGIISQITILGGRVDTAELSIIDLDDRLTTTQGALYEAIADISRLDADKIDTDLTIIDEETHNPKYQKVTPKDMNISDIEKLLLYVNANGIPSYAKLNDLGFTRIKDWSVENFNKVDAGDLLIKKLVKESGE